MLRRIGSCHNLKCRYNNDTVCSLRKKHCAWRVKQETGTEPPEHTFGSFVDLSRQSSAVKLRDRNKEAGDIMC